jgi:hypothetical protein
MRYALIPFMALAAPLLASAEPAGKEPHMTAISPVFHELVAFTLPAEFKSQNASYERTNGPFYIREHVPAGETVDHWTQMITLTGTKDLASNQNATPRAVLSSLTSHFGRHCPDTFATTELGEQAIGEHPAFAVIASCGHVQSGAESFSETAIMLVIKGSADYYSIQWARRGPSSMRALPLDSGYWNKQLDRLRPIRVCPIVPGEVAPYPSCVEH